MKHEPLTPTDLRKATERLVAARMADALLAADSRRARRMEANRGNGGARKPTAPDPDPTRPQPLRLSDLARLHPLAPRGARGSR
jgi:hypothetical protein